MSSSIRPPGAPPPGPSGLSALDDLKPAQPERSEAGARVEQAAPELQAAPSPAADMLRRLDAGELSRAQAVDALVAQAVDAQGGARLTPAQRAELSDVLRQALLGDPVLGSLLGAAPGPESR